jgi:acyl carrier protein
MPETFKAPHCEERDTASALQLIQVAVNQVTGKSVPITSNTRMDQYFNDVAGADSLEYLDLSFRLEDKLGVKLSQDDWRFLSGSELCQSNEEWEVKFAPMFTFGRLAELVAHRAKLGRVEPATILGATSLSAGAFRCIETIAKEIDNKIKLFAPSTPILDCFEGRKLHQFWGRLRALSADRIPPLLFGRIDQALAWLGGLWGILLCLALYAVMVWKLIVVFGFSVADPFWKAFLYFSLPVILLFLSSKALHFLVARLRPASSVLPNGIETFRDVAKLVAGEREGWCEKCGYDLTGLTSSRCPECGTEIFSARLPFKKNIEAVGSQVS